MKIKGKQLADTLRTESTPFDIIYSDRVLGDLNGAIRFTAVNNVTNVDTNNLDTIGAYKVVYITGQSGNLPTIGLADADSSAMPAFGLTVRSSDYQEEVDVVTFGNLKGVDTSSLSVGDILYVSTTPGEYTTTPPAGTGSKIQNIGMVVKSDSNGIIKVGGAGRSNATPNLDEGHFFLGNNLNQSVQSSYELPTSIDTSGKVLASDGTNVTFQTISSGGGYTFDPISSNTNAQAQYHYSCNTSGGAFTLTLPALSGLTAGQEIRIKLATAGNDLTIARTGTDTIEGVSSNYVLSVAKSAITLVANVAGTDWEII